MTNKYKPRSLYGLAETNPAAIIAIMDMLINRLGGEITITRDENDAYEGVDASDLVYICADADNFKLTSVSSDVKAKGDAQ